MILGRRSTRTLVVAFGSLFLGAATLALTAQPSRAGAPSGCPDVMFIGARGSGEPTEVTKKGKTVGVYHGVGKPLAYMAGLLGSYVDSYQETMRILPILYSADSVDKLKPSKAEIAEMVVAGPSGALGIYESRNLGPYERSIAQGVSRTLDAIHQTIDNCPESELVLAGYSQGAMAVHQAEVKLERQGDEEALGAIGGTLLIGDGDRTPNTQARIFGLAPSGGEGVQVYFGRQRPVDVSEPETTAEICARGDIVCDFKFHLDKAFYTEGTHVHSSYDDEPQQAFLRQAVTWLAEEMGLTG